MAAGTAPSSAMPSGTCSPPKTRTESKHRGAASHHQHQPSAFNI
jgi:hypothetical protein